MFVLIGYSLARPKRTCLNFFVMTLKFWGQATNKVTLTIETDHFPTLCRLLA